MLEVRHNNKTYEARSVSEALQAFREVYGKDAYLVKTGTNRGWRVEIKRDGNTFYLGDIKDPTRHVMTPAFVPSPFGLGGH